VVVLAEEMGSGMTVGELAWFCQYTSTPPPAYLNLEIHMGLCASNELGSDFAANYIPGTKVLVFQSDSLVINTEPDEWASIPLQTPFTYDGEENLIIDIIHDSGGGMFYTWTWMTSTNRSLEAWSSNPETPGNPNDQAPFMMLSSPTGMEVRTFGSIKRLFGGF
jgi:hypothetical protein